MADIYVAGCKKCGGFPVAARENGRELLRCVKCGYSVDVCATEECERIKHEEQRFYETVIPRDAAMKAIEKWNEREEVNGR